MTVNVIYFAQDTLAEATALLVGLESPNPDDSMDVDEEVTDKMPSSSEDSPDESVQNEETEPNLSAGNQGHQEDVVGVATKFNFKPRRRRMMINRREFM